MHRNLAISMTLLLAGCGKAPESADKKVASAEPAMTSPSSAPAMFQPGKWQQTSELVSMEVPGLPPEVAKRNVGQKTSFEHCITPEQAARPASDFFANNAHTTDCTTKSFVMNGGKLDSVMVCKNKDTPGEMTMTIKGDYQPTSYTATMTMVTDGAPNGGEMKITATTSGQRIGECEAKGG